jgi:hypothetical protein
MYNSKKKKQQRVCVALSYCVDFIIQNMRLEYKHLGPTGDKLFNE